MQFKYLGYIITSDKKFCKETYKQIEIAKEAFRKMKPILTNRNITMETKLWVLKSYIWSCLLYSCESWTITEQLEKKLKATEMWFLWRVLRIPWTAKKTNEEILQLVKCDRQLITTVRKRQLQFLCHIYRKREIKQLTLTGKIEDKRARGRQRIKFIDSLNKWASNINIPNNTFLQQTTDKSWKTMIADVCNRSGT